MNGSFKIAEELIEMSATKEKVDKLDARAGFLEQQFAATRAKADTPAEEAKQQREDIRQLNVRIDSKLTA